MANSRDDRSPGYRELSYQLDEVMTKLQSSDVGIDEAVRLFEQALKIIQQLEDHLQKAENHILELKAKFSEGV